MATKKFLGSSIKMTNLILHNQQYLFGTIAVWFSCGAASAVAAQSPLRRYGHVADIKIINNPVAEEDEDNQRFLKDVEKWLGVKIEFAINRKYPSCSAHDVWSKQRYMSGVQGAPCTGELKKEARRQYELNNHIDWHVLGFTSEEQKRSDRFIKGERPNLLPILIEENLTKKDCFEIIKAAGIKLPNIYNLGYPNANCIGCVKSASPTYWNHVRNMHPKIFQQRAELSRDIGCRLVKVKGERIFLDELDPKAKGRPMKNLDFECGIFCEERF